MDFLFSRVLNFAYPPFCIESREYNYIWNHKNQTFVTFSCSSKLSNEIKAVSKILEGCFSRFHADFNSSVTLGINSTSVLSYCKFCIYWVDENTKFYIRHLQINGCNSIQTHVGFSAKDKTLTFSRLVVNWKVRKCDWKTQLCHYVTIL